MESIRFIIFDDEELTRTLIESYLKEIAFPFDVEKYDSYEEGLVTCTDNPKIVVANINKVNISVLESISKLTENKNNNFIVISQDDSTDVQVQCLRAGVKDFLLKPLKKSEFIHSVQKISKKYIDELESNPTGKMYTATSLEKGSGKTFFLINLAKEVADVTGEKVLLIDFNNDINDMSSFLNINIRENTSYFMNNLTASNFDVLMQKIPTYPNSTLDIIANGFFRSATNKIYVDRMCNSIKLLRNKYKYIFIDMDPAEEEVFESIKKCSDLIFYIMFPMVNSLARTKAFIEEEYSKSCIELVLNRYEDKHKAKIEQIQSILGREISWILPKNFIAVDTAMKNFKTLKEVSPNLDIVQAYIKMATGIANRD